MKKTSKLLLLPAVMLCGVAMAQSDAGSSTQLLTQQKNIKAYAHFTQNVGTKSTAMLEFYNTGKNKAVVSWAVKNSEGVTICSGVSHAVEPGIMEPAYTNKGNENPRDEEVLSEALNNPSNSVVINIIN